MAEDTVPTALPKPSDPTCSTGNNGKSAVGGDASLPDRNQGAEGKSISGEPAGQELPPNEELLAPEDINFTKEDLLLYSFCAILMVFLGIFFWTTQTRLEQNLLDEEVKNIGAAGPAATAPVEYYNNYLQTQSVASARRYRYGARILLTNSTRKNTGFMVGTMIALLGCIMVVRRVRKMPIMADFAASEKARLRVITGSPGLFVTLLGALIILSTIIRYDSFELSDAVIQPPGSFTVEGTSTPTPTPSSGNARGNTTNKSSGLTQEQIDKAEQLHKAAEEELKGGQHE
jgi:hypothetical protein